MAQIVNSQPSKTRKTNIRLEKSEGTEGRETEGGGAGVEMEEGGEKQGGKSADPPSHRRREQSQ